MSIRGAVTFECDTKGCHAEEVIDVDGCDISEEMATSGVQVEFYAFGWRMDDDGLLHCPECCLAEEIDEAYERAAAKARGNDFADTGGKDWT